MTENKSLLLYARLATRLEDFMSLRGLPSALLRIYACVVLRLFFILCVLCEEKINLPYLILPPKRSTTKSIRAKKDRLRNRWWRKGPRRNGRAEKLCTRRYT